MTVINEELVSDLAKYKLKIMVDHEDGFKWVQCVIRVSISPNIRMFSNDVKYAYPKNSGSPPANSMEMATNLCLQELADRLQYEHGLTV